jgi:hypothetical protein
MRLKRLLNAPFEVSVVQIPNSPLYDARLFLSGRKTSWSCGHRHKTAEMAYRCKSSVERAWTVAKLKAEQCESLGRTDDGHDLFSIALPDPVTGSTVHPRIIVERNNWLNRSRTKP